MNLSLVLIPHPVYNLICNAPPSWGVHVSKKIENVCNILALPLRVANITLMKYHSKEDMKYGYIVARASEDNIGYDICINKAYCTTKQQTIKTLEHEVAHLLEHYITMRFSHEDNFNDMLSYIRGGYE
jgi:hypothetical protein